MQVAVTAAGGAPGGQEHLGAVALVAPAQLDGQQEAFLRDGDGGDGAVGRRRAIVLGQADPAAEDVRGAGNKGLAGLAIMTDLGADASFIRFRYGGCCSGGLVVLGWWGAGRFWRPEGTVKNVGAGRRHAARNGCGRGGFWHCRRAGAAAHPVVDQVAPERARCAAASTAEGRGGAAGLAVRGLPEDVEQAHPRRRRPVAADERDDLADQAVAGRIGNHPGDLAIVLFGLAGADLRRQYACDAFPGAKRLGSLYRRERSWRLQGKTLRVGHAGGGPDGQAQRARQSVTGTFGDLRIVEAGQHDPERIAQRLGDRANRRDLVMGDPGAAPEQVGAWCFGCENILERSEVAESTDRQGAPECSLGAGWQIVWGQRGVFKRGDGQQTEGILIAAGRAVDQGTNA